MPVNLFVQYKDNIGRLKGRELLSLIDIVQFPHAGASDRQKIIAKLNVKDDFEKKTVSPLELNTIIKGMVKK